MTFRALCGGLLLSVLSAAGCGTMANLTHSNADGGPVPFGGIKRDMAVLDKPPVEGPGPVTHRKPQPDQYPHQVLSVLCAVDLPFSLVGDLLTLAYTEAYTTINEPVPVPPITFAGAPAALPLPPAPPSTKPIPAPPAPPIPAPVGPPEPLPKPAKLPPPK